MWFTTASVLSVVVFNSSPINGGPRQSPENWPVALIHHRQAALDYASKTEANSGCACLKTFMNLQKEERKDVCLNYLAHAISFSIPPDNTDYVKDDFKNLVERTFEKEQNVFHESLPYKSVQGEGETSAHMCILGEGHESWALSAGHHEGVYLVYKASAKSSKPELFGLLEEMPQIVRDLTQTELDKMYETGGEKIVPEFEPQFSKNENGVRSLCELNDHERFRLCAVGYLAHEHSRTQKPDYPKGNYIQIGPPKCIRSSIVIERLGPENESSISADIITCPINVESKEATLFFTSDPHSADSMFSVEPQWQRAISNHVANNEGYIGTGFYLEYHMSNVRVLKASCDRCTFNSLWTTNWLD